MSRQLVTTIPTRRLPKKLVLGEVTPDFIKNFDNEEAEHVDEAGQRGQYLWIRGLTRLQHQVIRKSGNTFFLLSSIMLCGFHICWLQHCYFLHSWLWLVLSFLDLITVSCCCVRVCMYLLSVYSLLCISSYCMLYTWSSNLVYCDCGKIDL